MSDRPILHRRPFPRLSRAEDEELQRLIKKKVDGEYGLLPGATRQYLSGADLARFNELCEKSWTPKPVWPVRTKPEHYHRFTGMPGRRFTKGE